MRWTVDGREYSTATAMELAHSGRSRYGEPKTRLYRASDGGDFTVSQDPDGDYPDEVEFSLVNEQDARAIYLDMPVHLADEDEAFGEAARRE
jgi:hypothetical protein